MHQYLIGNVVSTPDIIHPTEMGSIICEYIDASHSLVWNKFTFYWETIAFEFDFHCPKCLLFEQVDWIYLVLEKWKIMYDWPWNKGYLVTSEEIRLIFTCGKITSENIGESLHDWPNKSLFTSNHKLIYFLPTISCFEDTIKSRDKTTIGRFVLFHQGLHI